MILVNSVHLNVAAEGMWKWEQTGRSDESLREEAEKHVAEYCKTMKLPNWMVGLLLDTMRLTVRIANGYPPDYGVVPDHD
jgi:hypothetical protein